MGILTLLRNAFGRSRKPRPAEAEGADQLPSQSKQQAPEAPAAVPEPREATTDEHELVSAAFDNVTVPKQATRTIEPDLDLHPEPPTEPEPAEPTAEPEVAEPEPAAEVTEEAAPEPAAEPVAQAEVTEPAAEPAAEAPAEPETEPVTEVAAEAEPTPDPEPEPETEPVAEAKVEPEPEPQPEPEAEAAATPEPVAETAPEPTPEPAEAAAETATPEPAAAADGESAPQGPPAPDDETVTGGAGGNTKAEGEAEATAPEPAAAADGESAPHATPAEGEAAAALAKAGVTGTTAATYLVLDRSASMRAYYKDGSAAALADQTLALATRLTPDGETPSVHVVFFSTEVDGTTDLTPTSPENAIDEAHAGLGRMGRTSYHAAVEAVLAHYDANATPGTPALVVFQTDGAPDAKTPATQSLTDAAKSHPSVFFSFVAFGEHENRAFDYLRKLKTDNTAFFHAGPTPLELTDAELYDGLLIDWRP
ncbi:MAG: VWA domain-containing protein [Streptomyces sp.]|uniref:VWA domain-containing protein n=1 Tax=Streptomyces sp. TaxID=1931 RepID=UPI0025CE9AD8|nr:VWA domain-containing protein [Streptomyces sp.]MBW8797981.1 VWA domain-containing protein [Streptomyces sp.]